MISSPAIPGSQSLASKLHHAGGGLFGLDGGGSDQNVLADYLRSIGLNIPGGVNARAFSKGQLLGSLLGQLNAPTGLEGFYGPEFQQRAVGSTIAQTGAPFAEAGRLLTSNYLRTGTGGTGALTQAREGLARTQGQTTGTALQQLLMGLEEHRAGLVTEQEQIRQNRQALLANFLNRVAAGHAEGKAAKAQQQAQTGQQVGQGIGGLLALLALL